MAAQLEAPSAAHAPSAPTIRRGTGARAKPGSMRPVHAVPQPTTVQARISSIAAPDSARPSSSMLTGLDQMPEVDFTSPVLRAKIGFVRQHFPWCFKGVITREHFADDVVFEDPQSKFTGFPGYKANIEFIRNFLAPIYELHTLRQSGPHELDCHWTFSLQFWFNRYNPLKVLWDPRLVFSGVTTLGFDPETGKINKHIDRWDALDNNKFFSLEGFGWTLSQIVNFSQAPDLSTPVFQILQKLKTHEVRRYPAFQVAEVALPQQGPASTAPSGAKMNRLPLAADLHAAGDRLKQYFGGTNEARRSLPLTTPLFGTTGGQAQLYVGPTVKAETDLPLPATPAVTFQQIPGGLVAAGIFSGQPNQAAVEREVEQLRRAMAGQGLQADDAQEWALALYNGPSVPGPWRRNEVLIPVLEDSFKIW